MQITEFEDRYKEEVRSVIRVAFSSVGIPSPPHPLQISEADLEEIPERYFGRGRFWIALEESRVIGTVGILEQHQFPDVAKLKRMAVHPDYHGKGIAQSLFDHALAFVKENGYSKIFLSTRQVMKRAHRFYEKNGFVRVRVIDKNDGTSEYHFERSL